MKLDRTLQLSILEQLKDVYPEQIHPIKKMENAEHPDFAGNFIYLEEHGLVEIQKSNGIGIKLKDSLNNANITAKGLDFLEDDGGIDAILKTVTVKFDADNIRQTLLKHIETKASGPAKKTLREKISKLSDTALQKLLKDLLEKGLDQMPDLLQLIETIL